MTADLKEASTVAAGGHADVVHRYKRHGELFRPPPDDQHVMLAKWDGGCW